MSNASDQSRVAVRPAPAPHRVLGSHFAPLPRRVSGTERDLKRAIRRIPGPRATRMPRPGRRSETIGALTCV
jgi:hypothetical protein